MPEPPPLHAHLAPAAGTAEGLLVLDAFVEAQFRAFGVTSDMLDATREWCAAIP